MEKIFLSKIPRIPLDGSIDLTYRCNNNCRHCWLWLPENSKENENELSLDEIRRIVDEARGMGCQAWSISGGEPLLREDFSEIFDYITRKSIDYSLNTNGTLITPKIARQLARTGRVMVALYGATGEINDFITRTPGSFDAAMKGFNYLKEAGVRFIVQIVPMRSNFHQYEKMLELARSLSPHYRVGAPWLWLSSDHSEVRNNEIKKQRLDPKDVVALDDPDPVKDLARRRSEKTVGLDEHHYDFKKSDDRLFASCINSRRDFHIDPYGKMSFCYYIRDPALRYDLRQGTFKAGWDEFIPSLRDQVHACQEYLENCGSCKLRNDCRWCPVFGYLEHGRYSAKVDYLCQVAKETRQFKDDWKVTNLRYYQIAGVTIQLTTDFPIKKDTFAPKFEKFRVDEPGDDIIDIRLFSKLPELSSLGLGEPIFNKAPWSVYKQRDRWIYLGISSQNNEEKVNNISMFNQDYSQAVIFQPEYVFDNININSLTTLPSDLLLLSQVMADRQACYFHASGIKMNGHGFLFVGHSEAGKSTMMKILRDTGEILCDERMILRRWPEGFQIHGTWSHGELPDVSAASAPLRAIFFLDKSDNNEILPIHDKQEILGNLLSHVMRPIITAEWWEKTIDLADKIALEVPVYYLKFDRSGRVINILEDLL